MHAQACRGGGVKKGQKTACALYGRPLMEIQVLKKWVPSESEMDTMICIGHDISTHSLFYKQQAKEIITVVGAPA